jgi:hypothetical protein
MRFDMPGESADDVGDGGYFGPGGTHSMRCGERTKSVKVVPPFGEIARREVSRLSDDEIRLPLV